MQAETYHALWLDGSQRVSMNDLVDLSGLTEIEVHELVEVGALVPVNAGRTTSAKNFSGTLMQP